MSPKNFDKEHQKYIIFIKPPCVEKFIYLIINQVLFHDKEDKNFIIIPSLGGESDQKKDLEDFYKL